MSIDVIMSVTSCIVTVIVGIVTTYIQRNLNKKHVQFKKLETCYLQFIKNVCSINEHEITDDIIDLIMKELKKVYLQMLQGSNGEEDDVRIIIRKYVESTEQLVTVYCLPHDILVSKNISVSGNEYLQTKYLFTNMYFNGNQLQDKFTLNIQNNNYLSYISYVIKEKEKIIGIITISSAKKINERYSYENIKSLFSPIENILIMYLKEKNTKD